MEVNGLGSAHSASLFKASRTHSPSPNLESRPLSPRDTVEISAAGRAAESAAKTPLRAERLARIKAEIDAGTYDTPERLEAALERMFVAHGIGDE
jgi:negative regulator of flagellin synthesis FlgM